MPNPDAVNGLFELTGALLVWMNVWRVVRDRGYAGVYPPAIAFFFAWGLWNLFYYSDLEQWWSLIGGSLLVVANLHWVFTLAIFGRRKDGWNG